MSISGKMMMITTIMAIIVDLTMMAVATLLDAMVMIKIGCNGWELLNYAENGR